VILRIGKPEGAKAEGFKVILKQIAGGTGKG
jgi:hypothetical protein